MTRNAQLAIEFIMLMAMALIIGALFLASANQLFSDASDHQRVAAINDIGYSIQDEIILALEVTDGYERTLTLPDRADRFLYEIDSQPTRITITSGTVKISYDHPQITGAFTKGENTITKNNGEVTVS
jgi:hypothetical protein